MSIAKGGTSATKFYLGDTEVTKIYKGDTLVYGSESPVLPYDAEVWFIGNTDMQYIDTGFKPNQDTRIVAKMKCTTSTTYGRLFGAGKYNAIGGLQVDFEKGITGNLYVKYGGKSSMDKVTAVTGDYNVHIYDYNKNAFYIDGVQVSSTTYTSFQSSSNLGIFNYINSNAIGGATEVFKGYLFYFQIYDNDVLVRDFIPVRVGQIGYLYDKVSGQLFGNAGTGNFSISGDKIEDYTERTYLLNQSNAYISTGIYADSDTYVEVGFKNNQALSSGKYPYPFGRRVGLSTGRYGLFYNGDNSYIYYCYNNGEFNTGMASDMNRHDVKFGNSKVIIDDNEVASLQGTFTSNTYPLLLFAENANGTTTPHTTYKFVGFIYYCKIYQSGILVRNFVPTLQNYDGTAGMFDKVNGVFYTSSNEAQFLIG